MKKPNLFLVGCGKSGTTTLYQALKQHPEVFFSEVKGPNFFGEYPDETFPEFLGNKEKYLSLFKNIKKEKIIGDASHYFHLESASQKIKKFSPNSKIIIILRNPFEVVRSYYNGGAIAFRTPLESNSKVLQVKELLESIKYSRNINFWFKRFGRKNVKIILFEDLVKNLEETYKTLCGFLKINPSFSPEFRAYSKSTTSRNKWLSNLLDKVPLKLKNSVKNILKDGGTRKIQLFLISIVRGKVIKKKLDPSIKINLKDQLFKEIDKTSELIGKDLKKWKEDYINI